MFHALSRTFILPVLVELKPNPGAAAAVVVAVPKAGAVRAVKLEQIVA